RVYRRLIPACLATHRSLHPPAGDCHAGSNATDGADQSGRPRCRTRKGPEVMTSTRSIQPDARRSRRVAPMHIFDIGQAVRLRDGFARPALPADIYHITGKLPPRGDSLQYRIRNDDERHERVTTQEDLEPVVIPPSGSSLIERTFGHGQGTETQQPRDQKAEAGQGSAQA